MVFNLYIHSLSARMYPHNLQAYYTDAGKEPIGGGLELWQGFKFFQSVNLFFYRGHNFLNILIIM
jgi:eukaryotic translation initiation factor 2C